MLERDDWALMPGEQMVTDPETGARQIQLAPEDEADLREAMASTDLGPIGDIDGYLDERQARALRRRDSGDGAVQDPRD